jgi:hypothetical protein
MAAETRRIVSYCRLMSIVCHMMLRAQRRFGSWLAGVMEAGGLHDLAYVPGTTMTVL